MNIWDIVITGLLVAAAAGAAGTAFRKGGCGCGCEDCGSCAGGSCREKAGR